MSTQKEHGLVSRAVREALGTLVSPTVATQVVDRALKEAGLGSIPEGGPELSGWIAGPLRSHVESALGADAAELLAAQLAPVVAHATGAHKPAKKSPAKPAPPAAPRSRAEEPRASTRSAFSSDQPTGVVAQPPPVPGKGNDFNATARMGLSDTQRQALGAPRRKGSTTRHPQAFKVAEPTPPRRVLAATSANDATDALQKYLGSTARVEQVTDLVALLDALEEPSNTQTIVLVDCQRPTVHVTSIAAIGEDLPRGTTVVLWGSSETAWNELDRDRMPNTRWVRCSQEATTDDVGSLCAMLIG